MNLADIVVAEEALPGNPETARAALAEAVTAATPDNAPAATPPAASPAPAANDADVPEKFRGKSVKDVVDMYQNLESRLGTMANDLGVQRQLTDRILDLKRNTDLQANTPKTPASPPVTSADLLDRPQETLERVIEERVARVTEDVNARLARAEAALAHQTFAARHPDFQAVTSDPKFVAWVNAKPLRLRAAQAANQGNWQIADELLSDYKDSVGAPARAPETAATPRADLEGARRASLETSGSASGVDGKSTGGKKIYRRADLMRLRITDPAAYEDEAFQDEILKAYAEGRVK